EEVNPMMKTAAGHYRRASSALAAVFCGLLGGCAPSHPLYSTETEKQVNAYLETHCPSSSSGIAHYEALTTAEGKVDPPSADGANSDARTQLNADSRQLDRLVATCAAGADDRWVRDAAALWFASDSMRETYSCPSAEAGGDRKAMFLCQQTVISRRS